MTLDQQNPPHRSTDMVLAAWTHDEAPFEGEGRLATVAITLSGVALPGARVLIEIGERAVNEVADDEGRYAIKVSTACPDDIVTVIARGAETLGRPASSSLPRSIR